MSQLVDFHSHLFSSVFFETLAAASPLEGTVPGKIAKACEKAGIEAPSGVLTEHVARWMSELDRHNVTHMVTFASVPEEAQAVADAVRLSSGRLSGFAVMNPTLPKAPEQVGQLFDELGMRGLVLFPALHGYRVDDPDLAPVFAELEARGGIAVVHCGLLSIPLRDHFGLRRPQDLTLANPLYLVPVANRHRRASFLVPHMGAGLFRETLMLGAQCENAFVDTSSSNSWIATQVSQLRLADALQRVLAVFGPERVLFGTDSSVLPRGWRRDILLAQREALGSIDISSRDRDLVFGGNASRLLLLE